MARYSGVSGYCAAAAEIEAETDIRLRRLWLAVDVGRVITSGPAAALTNPAAGYRDVELAHGPADKRCG